MARKKAGDGEPVATAVPSRDVLQRLNYLHQASTLLETVLEPESTSYQAISKHVRRSMQDVGKKSTLRIDPVLKRRTCRGCNGALLPGLTCSSRSKPSGPHGHVLVTQCYSCGTRLRLPAPPVVAAAEATNQQEMVPEGIAAASPAKVHRRDARRAKKQGRMAKQLPFNERDGHVVFVGSTRVTDG